MPLKILPDSDPILHKKSPPVRQISPEKYGPILTEMKKLLDDDGAVGLAAPQVGISERFFLFRGLEKMGRGDPRDAPLFVAFNPEILETVGAPVPMLEGCLSSPGIFGKVLRFREIRARWWDEAGQPLEGTLRGAAAHIFQHESDHLDGEIFLDKIIPGTREEHTSRANFEGDPGV